MTNYRIFIGTKDGDKNVYLYDNEFYRNVIITTLDMNNIDGATVYNTIGIWKDEKENSFIVEVLDTENKLAYNVNRFIEDIKFAFNQKCILMEKQNIGAEFI